jgi:hypothetical protein
VEELKLLEDILKFQTERDGLIKQLVNTIQSKKPQDKFSSQLKEYLNEIIKKNIDLEKELSNMRIQLYSQFLY